MLPRRARDKYYSGQLDSCGRSITGAPSDAPCPKANCGRINDGIKAA